MHAASVRSPSRIFSQPVRTSRHAEAPVLDGHTAYPPGWTPGGLKTAVRIEPDCGHWLWRDAGPRMPVSSVMLLCVVVLCLNTLIELLSW